MASEVLPLCHKRYALMVSYIGTNYKGSQRLTKRGSSGGENKDTIQESLETALQTVLPIKECRLTASSRTDRGVHSLMSCYSLPLISYGCSTERIKRMANSFLIKKRHEIVIQEVLLVPADFHPQKSAVSREYIYRVGLLRNIPSFERSMSKANIGNLFSSLPLNEIYRILPLEQFNLEMAEEAANLLRGEHDFRSFGLQTKADDDTVRNLEISINPVDSQIFPQECNNLDIYHFHFRSKSFLYNQVRRMMGAILGFASMRTTKLETIKDLVDRPQNWPMHIMLSQPWGLYLSRINYPISALRGTTRTYDDEREEEVQLESLRGMVTESDDKNNGASSDEG